MDHQTAANLGVGTGFVLQIVAGILVRVGNGGPLTMVGVLLALLALPCYIYGGINYAQYKNYEWYVGLLAILGLCGFIILVCLPTQTPRGRTPIGRRKKKRRPRDDYDDDEDDDPPPRRKRRRDDDDDDEDDDDRPRRKRRRRDDDDDD